MEFKITGKHVEVTPSIREYAEKKTNKLHKYFDKIQSFTVIIDKHDNHSFEVEFITDIEHHDPIVSKTHGDDLYACIDLNTDKTERQLTDYKNKLKARLKGNA